MKVLIAEDRELERLALQRMVEDLGHERAAYTYVILLTVLDEKHHRLAGIHAGADDYMVKPLAIDALEARLVAAGRLTALHRTISQREAERERTIARRQALLGVACRFAAAGDAERLLTELLAEAVVLLGGTSGSVSEWDESRGILVPVRNTIPVAAGPRLDGVGERASGQAVERRATVIVNDYQRMEGTEGPQTTEAQIQAAI